MIARLHVDNNQLRSWSKVAAIVDLLPFLAGLPDPPCGCGKAQEASAAQRYDTARAALAALDEAKASQLKKLVDVGELVVAWGVPTRTKRI